MTKLIPLNSPLYYWTLSEATYRNDSDAFIKESFPDAEVLEKADEFNFPFLLVKKGDEFSVAFQGTDPKNIKHWGIDIANHLIKFPANKEKIEKVITYWEEKYKCKISVFIGHSAGGYFASRVMACADIFRITFNCHKPKRGKKNINLRTERDYRFISVKGRGICVGPGDHTNLNFKPLLIGRTWTDLSTKFKILTAAEPSQSTTPAISRETTTSNTHCLFEAPDTVEPSQLLASLVGLQAATTELADQLAQEKTLIDDANLDKNLQELSESCPAVALELQNEMEQNGSLRTALIKGGEQLAVEVYSFFKDSEEERFRRQHIKEFERQIQKHKEHGERTLEAHEDNYTFQQVESRISHSLNPNGIGQTVREINVFAEKYKKNARLLKESLQRNRKAGETLQQQLQNIDKLDLESKKYYQKLLKSQQKLGKELRIFSGILNVTSVVLSSISVVHPAFLIAAGAAQIGNRLIGEGLAKKRAQTERHYQKTIQKHIEIRERIYSVSSQIGSQKAHLQEQQHHLQELLVHRGDLFDPKTHLEGLKESVDQLEDELEDVERKLADKQKTLETESKAVSDYETERTGLKLTSQTHKNKDLRRMARHRLKVIEPQIVAKTTRRTELEQEVQNLKALKGTTKDVLDETQVCFDETQFVAPIKVHAWTVIVREERRWTPTDEKTRALQLVVQQNFKRYSEARLTSHQVAEAGMSAAMGLATELEKLTGSQRFPQAVSLISQLYQLRDLHKYWNDFAGPQLQMLKDRYAKGSWTNVKEAMGTATFILQFCVPAIRTVTIGLSCIRTAKALFSSPKQGPTELEIYLQALEQTTQQFKSLLDHTFDSLQSKMDQHQTEILAQISKVRRNLAVVGDHLLREINAGKTEIIQDNRDGRYNQYIDVLERLEQNLSTEIALVTLQLEHAKHSEKTTLLAQLLSPFLGKIETNLGIITRGNNNGINLGHSTQVDGLQPHPVVDITLAYRNPAHLTGLLAVKLGVQGELPNWQLLETVTGGFLEAMGCIAQDKTYWDVIKTDEQARNRLIGICSVILEHQMEIESLTGQMRGLIHHVCNHQRMLLQQMIHRSKRVLILKPHWIIQFQEISLARFEQLPRRHLVGSAKFFLHTAFVEKPLPLPSWNFEQIARESHQHYVAWKSTQFAEGFGSLVRPSVQPYLASVVYPLMSVDTPPVNGIEQGKTQLYFENEMRRPLKRVVSIASQGGFLVPGNPRHVNSSPHQSIILSPIVGAHKCFELALDLKQRNITCLTSNPLAYQVSLLNLHVNVVGEEVGIEFQNHSLIQLADLERIPEPGYVQHDAAEYDKTITTLIDGYTNYLAHAIQRKELAPNNPFQEIAKTSQIVPGIKDQLVPLALPRKLIKQLEEQLEPELRYLEALGEGTLVPFYNFSANDLRLIITYRYVSAKNPAELTDYCNFTVAQFNQSTVYAFQKELRSGEAGLDNHTEFLIQALYASFGSDLGLPGSGTEITSHGLIAPKEVSFVGLYRLWERFPEFMINYRSSEYTEVLGKALKTSLKDEKADISQFPTIMQPIQRAEFCEDYLDLWTTILELKKEFTADEVKFKADFYLLLAMVKLLSGIDNTTLFEQLDRDLAILPPEQQNSFADRFIDQDQLPVVSPEKVNAFVKLLEKVPSQKLRRLEEQQAKVLELQMHLMNV